MLEAVIIALLVLWLFGLVAGQTIGGFLHLILLVALVMFVVRLFTGRKTV